MGITQRPSEIANYLYHCTDEEYAEVFALYYHMSRHDIPSAADTEDAEDIHLSAFNMRINLEILTKHIGNILNEIIYSDEIDSSAWWKENKYE